MKQSRLTQLQDIKDYKDAVKAEKEDNGQTVSRFKVMKELKNYNK